MIFLFSISWGIKFYNSLPLWLQGVMGFILRPIPLKLRGHGKVFDLTREISRENSEDGLEKIVIGKLKEVLVHASENVPYYSEIFNGIGFDPKKIEKVGDLVSLPILTKKVVREQSGFLTSKGAEEFNPGKVRTSGSTGEPLEFLLDEKTRISEYAAEWRCLLENGANLGGRTASLRGNHYRNHRRKGAHWFYNALSGSLDFNTYAMTEEACEIYVRRLRMFRPEIFRAFPSSLSHLGRFVKEGKLSPDAVAFCSSEMMDGEMKDIIEAKICDTVINWYSQSEYVVSAGTCAFGKMHVNSEFGIIEVLDDDGNPVPDGTVGRLVGTSLTNFSQPFIRYDLDDIGSISTEGCDCGRPHPIIEKIHGRASDLMITPDGRGLSTVQMQHWWKHQAVKEWDLDIFEWIQIVQKDLARFVVKVVAKEGVSVENHLNQITDSLSDLWGERVIVSIKELKGIPNGEKWRFSISEI